MISDDRPEGLPPAVLRTAAALRFWGWVGFWCQVILAVVSGIVLLFAGFRDPVQAGAAAASGSANIPGVTMAWLSLACAGGNIGWHFRYTVLAKQLRSPTRPSKNQTALQLKIGTAVSLVGMILALVGGQAIVGTLTFKALQPPPQGVASTNPAQFVQPIDFFVLQANTNILLSHFVGLLTSLWLLDRLSQPEK
ncbi:MAG: DUF3611 family protein [Oscillatoriales cyanobacterium SM2_1_8]|nr:DUF3611 family protein [Oscillatoriales cyanobacterium SM2_1_8]